MHVLGIASWYPTKAEPLKGTFFKEQFEALEKKGIKVTVLAIDFRSIRRVRRFGLYYQKENGLDVFRLSIPLGPLKIEVYEKIVFRIYKFVYKRIIKNVGQPDIIHAHAVSAAGILGMKMSQYFRIPFAITEHSTGLYKIDENNEEKKIYSKVYNAANKVISVSPNFNEMIGKIKGDSENIDYIPNLINFDHFSPKEKINNDKEEFVFISIGFLTHKKGMDIVIKAFAIFNDKYPNSKLKIVGYGEDFEKLNSLAVALNKVESIEFLGAVTRENLPSVINTTNCLVMGSRLETFGVIFIEALACGIPIIGTDCDGPRVIINKQNGLLVEIDQPHKTKEAMEQIYINYDKYIKKEIRSDAEKKYSENSVSEKIISIYKEISKCDIK